MLWLLRSFTACSETFVVHLCLLDLGFPPIGFLPPLLLLPSAVASWVLQFSPKPLVVCGSSPGMPRCILHHCGGGSACGSGSANVEEFFFVFFPWVGPVCWNNCTHGPPMMVQSHWSLWWSYGFFPPFMGPMCCLFHPSIRSHFLWFLWVSMVFMVHMFFHGFYGSMVLYGPILVHWILSLKASPKIPSQTRFSSCLPKPGYRWMIMGLHEVDVPSFVASRFVSFYMFGRIRLCPWTSNPWFLWFHGFLVNV